MLTGKNVTSAAISTATTGASLVAAVTGKKIHVLGVMAMADADVDMTLNSASTAKTGAVPMGAKGNGFVLPLSGGYPWFSTAAGEAVTITLSSAVQVEGIIVYFVE